MYNVTSMICMCVRVFRWIRQSLRFVHKYQTRHALRTFWGWLMIPRPIRKSSEVANWQTHTHHTPSLVWRLIESTRKPIIARRSETQEFRHSVILQTGYECHNPKKKQGKSCKPGKHHRITILWIGFGIFWYPFWGYYGHLWTYLYYMTRHVSN